MLGLEDAPMNRMLRIGQFARRTGLSIRTLRFYDAVDVLRPVEVDARTGYRHYALHQLASARRVVALRRLGLELDEIRRALAGAVAEREVLVAARARLERSIDRQSTQLSELDSRLALSDLTLADAGIEVRREPARWVAGIRDRLSAASQVAELFLELRRGLGYPGAGREGVLWHRCAGDHGGLSAEAFVEVPRSTRSRGRVSVFELPAAEVASVRTVDDDEPAELGYRALRAWLARERQTLQGAKREMALPADPGWLEIAFPFRTVAAG
jgi:DNA-binding transcriptional MerR regulator